MIAPFKLLGGAANCVGSQTALAWIGWKFIAMRQQIGLRRRHHRHTVVGQMQADGCAQIQRLFHIGRDDEDVTE